MKRRVFGFSLIMIFGMTLVVGCGRGVKPEDKFAGKRTADTFLAVPMGFEFPGLIVDQRIFPGLFRPKGYGKSIWTDDYKKIYFEAKEVFERKNVLGQEMLTGGYIVKEFKNGDYIIEECYKIDRNGDLYRFELPGNLEYTLLSLDDDTGKIQILRDTRKDKSQPLPMINLQP